MRKVSEIQPWGDILIGKDKSLISLEAGITTTLPGACETERVQLAASTNLAPALKVFLVEFKVVSFLTAFLEYFSFWQVQRN